jgi:23S rRNA (cytosine1962-C5)-methyltransferase
VLDRGQAAPGDAVAVQDPRGNLLGLAHYSSTSQIVLRLLTPHTVEIGRDFFFERLQAALRHRERVVAGSDAYRLVHAEGDLLPGLIVDKYAETLVLQALTQGMDRAQALIVDCLGELLHPAAIVARNDAKVRQREGLAQEKTALLGDVVERTEISMNGLRFFVDVLGGQKTGAFLDQRENYLAAANHAQGDALDCFTGTGGFALHLAGRCHSVEAVDSSAPALAIAEANRDANQIANVDFRRADVFEYLSGCMRRFSTIVLDPPAFAKDRDSLDAAARGYK